MTLDARELDFLRSVVESIDFPDRKNAANPLDNSYWGNLIRGSLKGLTEVAKGSMDWKLTALVKLFQSWVEDKEAEQVQSGFPSDWNYQYSHLRQYSRGDSEDSERVDNLLDRVYYD